MSQKFIGYLKISKKFTMKKVINNIFFQVNGQNPNNLHESHHRSPFCPK